MADLVRPQTLITMLHFFFRKRSPRKTARCCMVTALSDDFVEYFLVLMHSIRKHNRWFKHDVIILHGTTLSPLSKKNMERIRKAYAKVSFVAVDEAPYERFHADTPKRLWPALLKLAIFRIRGYDRIVFIDSDILCLGDISYLFTLDVPFAACPAGKDLERKRRVAGKVRWKVGINSGVMVIGKKYLNEATHEKLLRYRSGPCADQDVLTRFLRWRRVYCLPHEYNYHAEFFWHDTNRTNDDVRLLHYAGVKPLENPKLPRMKMWFEERNAMKKSS